MIRVILGRRPADRAARESKPADADSATTAAEHDANEADASSVADEQVVGATQSADEDQPAKSAENAATDTERTPAQVSDKPKHQRARRDWKRTLIFGLLPGIAMLTAAAAGYLKWEVSWTRDSQTARIESVQAASDNTIKMLSYRPDTVERSLSSAQDLMTAGFRDSYTKLTQDVVIPAAKQRQISAVASVPGAASVSASPTHAVVLVFVNQTIIVGTDPPTNSASTVKVTLDKHGDRWLISDFTPE